MAARSVRLAKALSLLVAAAGVIVVAAWLLHVPAVTSMSNGTNIKTNTGVCLAAIGLGNWILLSAQDWRARLAGQALALCAGLIGALTLSQHLVGWNLGIDQLIATEAPGSFATVSPNRMGPPASLASLLLGLALLTLDRPWPRLRRTGLACAAATCALTILPIMGFAYGLTMLYAVARLTGISPITAIALLLLGLAVQMGRPGMGLTAILCREDEIGRSSRRLAAAGIALPFALGWILARLHLAGIVDAPFAISTMALVLIAILAGLIWRTGTELARAADRRAATERALSLSEAELRAADQQKTEFLATLSHELRNPLAPIRFALELLDGPPATAAKARETVARQVTHLTRLVDDLLDLTRITRNQLELHPRACDLRQLVTDAVDGVAAEIAKARHRVDLELPAEPVWLQVDGDRVIQLLVNLLTNASRHSDPGGHITIAAAADREAVTIAVRDGGHGIAAADLERVFDRFVQVGDKRRGGLGLGLALVKTVAELHGGSVEARSGGRGQGAEFRVRLPRAAAPPAAEPPPDRPQPQTCAILVVDDNRDAADMLAGLLRLQGHHATVAYGGAEALRQAALAPFDAGLIDVGMPDMDGCALAQRLRADPGLRGMFLVAITGWGQEEDRRRALAAGFDAHMTKPAEPEALAALLAGRFAPRAAAASAAPSASAEPAASAASAKPAPSSPPA
jgi:signal transduction histidine kinase/CheY-like chemotaxis protein